MQSLYIFPLSFFLSFFLLAFPVSAQTGDPLDDETGPVGTTDDGSADNSDERTPGWADLEDPQWGLAGLVSERLPHDACDMCFTVPEVDEFQIYEYVETDGPEAVLISRRIPNPAPLEEGEVRDTVDADGEPVWYIGTQGIVGPTDEEIFSEKIPLPYIELRRIQRRHRRTMFAIPGVHGFGIGASGFHVSIVPDMADSADEVPTEIEGVPVIIELETEAVFYGHGGVLFRPIPSGARLGSTQGHATFGPHVVRDRPHVSSCCVLWSLTAAHSVKRDVTYSTTASPIYQPRIQKVGRTAYAFTLEQCDTPDDPYCNRSGAPVNESNHRPDIAAVQTAEGFRRSPYNTPQEDEDPVRRLQYGTNSYMKGPSGKIKAARAGDQLKIWGASGTHGTIGRVKIVDRCVKVRYRATGKRVSQCGIFVIRASAAVAGDSGSLVSFRGTSSRHVAGVLFAGNDGNDDRYVIPAMDIKEAFAAAGQGFSHYWGTKRGYRTPSTR